MFNLSVEERLKYWRRYRIGLSPLDTEECLDSVVQLWSKAPLVNQHLASDLPETWPTAWELISDNYYDEVGVALGMFYTLYYSEKFDENSIMYDVYKSTDGIINTVTLENKYVLNYDFGQVTPKEHIDFLPIFQYNHIEIVEAINNDRNNCN